jgi:VanZ family protein
MTPALPATGPGFLFPTSRHYGFLALGFLAFAVYGSLVPLDFRPLAIGDAMARYQAAWQRPIRVESRSDWLSNILLFIPLGFLIAGWLAVDRPRRAVAIAVLAIPAVSAALSAAIEFVQVYFPSRTVSSRDVVAETIGGAIGGVAWLAAGPWLTGLARAGAKSVGGRAAWLLPVYSLALILDHGIPLDVTISPGELYHKYKTGMIRLVPFGSGGSGLAESLKRSADEASGFLVVGLLLGRAMSGRSWSSRSVLVRGLGIAGAVEILQLFVASRRFDATDVVVGGLAVLAGWVAARATLGSPESGTIGCDRFLGLVGWLGLVAVSSWAPFDFGTDVRSWRTKALAITPLPFSDYYFGSVWNAAGQLFRKATLFLPLGMLSGRGRWETLLTASGLAVVFEAGQVALPGRQPSVTDVLVEVGGAWLGLFCVGRRMDLTSDEVES